MFPYPVLRVYLKLYIDVVVKAKRSHLFPCRTQQLSSSAPMVVGFTPVRVGRRHIDYSFLIVAFVDVTLFQRSSVVEQSAVNRSVVGSNHTVGATCFHSSVVEHFHGKEGVAGSNPAGSS